jgi:hypothetical protein
MFDLCSAAICFQPTYTRCSSVIFLGNLLDFESTLAGLLVLIVLSLTNNFLSLLQVCACIKLTLQQIMSDQRND